MQHVYIIIIIIIIFFIIIIIIITRVKMYWFAKTMLGTLKF